MEALFDSKVSAELSSKQQTLLQNLIMEAPQKTTGALCRQLLQPEMTANRQRYILDSLMALGKENSVGAVIEFTQRGLGKNKDVQDRADDVISVLIPDTPEDEKHVQTSKVGMQHGDRPAIIRNPNEYDALYILIPGGRYIYSQPEPKGTAVPVPDLWFAKYPVTNRQYRSFIGFLGGKPVENTQALSLKAYRQELRELANSGDNAVKGFDKYLKEETDLVKRFTSQYDDNRKFNKDEQPVAGVSWYGARAYCLWLSMLSGEEYRLPTEQEWEWAAGGWLMRKEPDRQKAMVVEYPWGDKPKPTPKHANYGENEGATTPVGRYPDGSTPEGLYDMAGNVWEWMENWYDSKIQKPSLRSGSWVANAGMLRCSARNYNDPNNRTNDIGFRIVRSLKMI